ncbi:MAG: AlpA family phage regulatory protein [Zoogloea sp.]|nr:AlpA family phage regulatory protein [Zoogloea sp.]
MIGAQPTDVHEKRGHARKKSTPKVLVKPLVVDIETVAAIVSMSVSGVQAQIRAGDFPQPRKVSPRRVGWLLREVEQWAESRPLSDLPPPPNTGAKKNGGNAR